MWNNQGGFTNYDQGGGGGFGSPGGFGSQTPLQRKRSKVQSLVPCTIAQLYNARVEGEAYFTAGTEFSQVVIIGLVRSVVQNATRMEYEIDDFTGPTMNVKQFLDNDESVPDAEKPNTPRENTYVRVSGNLKSFQGKRHIVGFKIVPILDYNEITCHLLEVIHAHAYMSKGQSMGAAAQNTSNTTGGFSAMPSDGGMQGFTSVQNQIHNLIKNNVTDEGASLESIMSVLKGYPIQGVKNAIEFLSSEGHIYTTVDDDHFKATDA